MRSASKLGWILGFVVFAVAVGGGLGWWLSQQGNIPPAPAVPPPLQAQNPPPPAPANPEPAPVAKPAQAEPAEPKPVANAMPPEDVPEYEDKLEKVLLGDGDEKEKAQGILDLIYATPSVEAKVDLSQHLINMTMDDNYGGAAGLLTNAATPSDVSQVLLNDLLNRNNRLKLPMLLEVARNDAHPLKAEAKEMLELFLQEDKGPNWADWETAVNDWLKENEPETEAAPAPQASATQ